MTELRESREKSGPPGEARDCCHRDNLTTRLQTAAVYLAAAAKASRGACCGTRCDCS